MEICITMGRYSSDLAMGLGSRAGAGHHIATGIWLEVALVDRKVTAHLVSAQPASGIIIEPNSGGLMPLVLKTTKI